MHKKYSVPMALGEIAHFRLLGQEAGFLRLDSLEIIDGALKWCMTSHERHTLIGNAVAEIQNPLFGKGCWVKPSIPIRMHVEKGQLKIEMIFNLPGSAFITVLPDSLTNA